MWVRWGTRQGCRWLTFPIWVVLIWDIQKKAWPGKILCILGDFDLWEAGVIIALKVHSFIIHMLGIKMVLSGERSWGAGAKPNCPFNMRFIGNKVKCHFFSTILAAPINGIIYYSITLFVNALKNLSTHVEQMALAGKWEINCLNY